MAEVCPESLVGRVEPLEVGKTVLVHTGWSSSIWWQVGILDKIPEEAPLLLRCLSAIVSLVDRGPSVCVFTS